MTQLFQFEFVGLFPHREILVSLRVCFGRLVLEWDPQKSLFHNLEADETGIYLLVTHFATHNLINCTSLFYPLHFVFAKVETDWCQYHWLPH